MQCRDRSVSLAILVLCLLTASPLVLAQAASSPRSAIERLHHLFRNQDQSFAAKEIADFAKKYPDNIELAGWRVVLGDHDPKVPEYVAAMKKQAPDSPWTLLAETEITSGPQVEKLCNEAIAKSSGDPYILYLATQRMGFAAYLSRDEATYKAFVEAHKSDYEKSSIGLAIDADVLKQFGHGEKSKVDSILAVYDKALKLDAGNVDAATGKAQLLDFLGKHAEAYELLAATLRNSPDSYTLHSHFWDAVLANPQMSADEQKKAILADATQFFKQHQPTAQVVGVALNDLERVASDTVAPIAKALIEQYPNSPASDASSLALAMQDLPMATPEQNVTAKINALEKFLDRPNHYDDGIVKQANRNLVNLLASQDNPDLDRLYKATVAIGGDPHAIVVLATHKVHLPELELMAMKQADDQLAVMPTNTLTQEDKSGFMHFWLDSFVEPWEDALGWVYYNEGKLDQAEAKLDFALKLSPRNVSTTIHLGDVYEAQGNLDKAEKTFMDAFEMPYYGEGAQPAIAALRDLYVKKHGSTNGVDAYLKPILEQDMQRRKRAILAARIRNPREIMPFTLKTLDGKTVTSADLKGKAVVINFWATWCGPCRRELPDLDKFYEKYKSDPRVMVLTMATDQEGGATASIRTFIDKTKYSFPVLLAPEYATKNEINTIPMTWFVDPTGHIVFSKLGYSKDLLQEFTWRLDAIVKQAGDSKD